MARVGDDGRGSRRSRARTQRQTAAMSRSRAAAAKSSGARSAWARSTQWADSLSEAPGRAARARAWAMVTARSKRLAADHRRPAQPVHPPRERNSIVPWVEDEDTAERPGDDAVAAMSTSGLVEVETTAAGASSTVGMTSVEVLPDRGGPMTRMAVSGPA